MRGVAAHSNDTMNLVRKMTLVRYESEGKARKTILARDLWFQILESQIETGTPYLLYKVKLIVRLPTTLRFTAFQDASNAKSNQKNLGTIKSSNLCTEIIEYMISQAPHSLS